MIGYCPKGFSVGGETIVHLQLVISRVSIYTFSHA